MRSGTGTLLSLADSNYTNVFTSAELTASGRNLSSAGLRARNTYSIPHSLAFYNFKNVNYDLYFTKALLSNLNSAKQVR
jgi:hypothetical protein